MYKINQDRWKKFSRFWIDNQKLLCSTFVLFK